MTHLHFLTFILLLFSEASAFINPLSQPRKSNTKSSSTTFASPHCRLPLPTTTTMQATVRDYVPLVTISLVLLDVVLGQPFLKKVMR